MKRPWFVVKRYGYGMEPRGWGWLVTFAYVALLASGIVWMGRFGRLPALLALLALTGAFLAVAAKTGDGKPWRWRSGEED